MFIAALLLALLKARRFRSAPPCRPRFCRHLVGTQSWAVTDPPPGADPRQPVSITIDVVDGKLTGTLTPFMGGEDGAAFVDAQIVGDELHASAVFGKPKPAPGAEAAGRTAAPAKTAIVDEDEDAPRVAPTGRKPRTSWKDTIKIQFAFTADRLDLKGTADVAMNDIPWLKFNYDLSKKRARY